MTNQTITADEKPAEEIKVIKRDAELTAAEKIIWGSLFGFFIGGAWMLADFVRPLIYGA